MVIVRHNLVQQLTGALCDDIGTGRWGVALPSEEAICHHYQVSRTTVRKALLQLRRDRVVETANGIGTRVVAPRARQSPEKPRTIGLLEPAPISELKPYQVLWINDLKSLLYKAGYELIIHIGKQYLRRNNAQALRKLVTQHAHRCWVLNLSNLPIQQWFSDQQLPCVVAGTCYERIDLPSVALDNHALGRHAAGRVLAAGHRRIAMLVEREPTPAWVKCVAGFTEACKAAAGEVELTVLRHDASLENVIHLLGRVFSGARRPTALMVINPFYYLTVTSFLASKQLRVPADVSLLTTYGDPFLGFVFPRPCRYDYRPRHYARDISKTILTIAEHAGSAAGATTKRLVPDYIHGASLATIRGAGSKA